MKDHVGEGAQQIQEKASEAKQNTRERVRQQPDLPLFGDQWFVTAINPMMPAA